MKKFFPILMAVALTAGCGSGIINADCDSSYEHFCDADILYRVDLCGNAVPQGQCEHGCNLEFTGCQVDCDIVGSLEPVQNNCTYAPVETGKYMTAGLRDLSRIEPVGR